VARDELRRVFNVGIGFVAVVPPEDAGRAIEALADVGTEAWAIGVVEPGRGVRFEP
jgi:phosphoribosylformylglycinamidine cyclo-ligase